MWMIKSYALLFVFGVVFFWGCKKPQKGFEVSNPLDYPVPDKVVVLDYEKVGDHLSDGLGENHILVVDQNGNKLPSQCDDLDGDGIWDELAFLVDLDAGKEKTVYFDVVPEEGVPDFPKRTNVRFV